MPPNENGAESPYPTSLNPLAIVVFAVAAIIGLGALFSLPTLQSMGLSFRASFLLVCAVEFGVALVTVTAVMRFYYTPELE